MPLKGNINMSNIIIYTAGNYATIDTGKTGYRYISARVKGRVYRVVGNHDDVRDAIKVVLGLSQVSELLPSWDTNAGPWYPL